jgi:hypothetical protein
MNEMVQRGVSHAIFETDSKSLVDAIKHIHAGVSDFSLIVQQINNVLSLTTTILTYNSANLIAFFSKALLKITNGHI